jgi:hypothetical protein
MAIANVVRRGSVLCIYNERGQQLCMLSIGSAPKDGLQGFTSSTVSIRRGNVVCTYDEKGRQLSMISAG